MIARTWRATARLYRRARRIDTPVLIGGLAVAVAVLGPIVAWAWAWAAYLIPKAVPIVAGLLVAVWLLRHRRGFRTVWFWLRRCRPRREDSSWWSEEALIGALTAAGLLRPPKADEPRHTLRRYGAPIHDQNGTTVVVRLPAGLVLSDLVAKRERIAAWLNAPLDQLTITQQPGQGPAIVRISITRPHQRTTRLVQPAAVTSWRAPLTIGVDHKGSDVTVPVYNTGLTLVGGRTGSGKSTALRMYAAHFAADPDALLYIADGKGAVDDWSPIRARCERLVMISDDDAEAAFLTMLDEIQALVSTRNRAGGREHPGTVVILEEYTSFLASLAGNARKDVERRVTRLAQTCRSANVALVVCAQRPASSMMSTDTRAQAGVAIALAMSSATDTQMVLGHIPTLPLPAEKGEALIVKGGADELAVDVDYFRDDVWARFGAALPVRVPTTTPAAQESFDRWEAEMHAPAAQPEPEPAREIPPLLAAVADTLTEPRTLTELWETLPAAARPATAQALSRELKDLGLTTTDPVRLGGRLGRFYTWENLQGVLLQHL